MCRVPQSVKCSTFVLFLSLNYYCARLHLSAKNWRPNHLVKFITLQAGRDEEKLVIWDYHVIALYRPEEVQVIIIITRPWPAFGWRGPGGSSGWYSFNFSSSSQSSRFLSKSYSSSSLSSQGWVVGMVHYHHDHDHCSFSS